MSKVCVFTGSRADYGLLRPLLAELERCQGVELRLLCSGTHLSRDFGRTAEEIEADGYTISERVDIHPTGMDEQSICASMSEALVEYAEALARLAPDILVVLGDRSEAFCAATAATVLRLPVAHIHGGEITMGAVDEAFRHSISKMSHLHFASTDVYRRRLIQLGEAPGRVWNTGALGIEALKNMKFMMPEQLSESLNIDLRPGFLLLTFHPETMSDTPPAQQIETVVQALHRFPRQTIICTKANADVGGRQINDRLARFTKEFPGTACLFESLGQTRYLSALKHCRAVVGNSSSGIIEAPSLGTVTVNIGDRQRGRVRAETVVDCPANTDAIADAIATALSPKMVHLVQDSQNPYDKSDTAARIAEVLINPPPCRQLLEKQFFDLPPASFPT